MPNGHANDRRYADIIADHDRFFAAVARGITDFATAHNLLLEKYYHEAPMWSLGFAHPAGGQARIDVTRTEEDGLSVGATWWIDDYDSFTRSIRVQNPVPTELVRAKLTPRLEQLLTEVLAWKPGDWTQVATGYKGIWDKTWTKAQFEKLAHQWPCPK